MLLTVGKIARVCRLNCETVSLSESDCKHGAEERTESNCECRCIRRRRAEVDPRSEIVKSSHGESLIEDFLSVALVLVACNARVLALEKPKVGDEEEEYETRRLEQSSSNIKRA